LAIFCFSQRIFVGWSTTLHSVPTRGGMGKPVQITGARRSGIRPRPKQISYDFAFLGVIRCN
jgi:hypothetical protein